MLSNKVVLILLGVLLIGAIVGFVMYRRETLVSAFNYIRRYELSSCGGQGTILGVGQSLYSHSDKSRATLLQGGLLLSNDSGFSRWYWVNDNPSRKVSYMRLLQATPQNQGAVAFYDDNGMLIQKFGMPMITMPQFSWTLTLTDSDDLGISAGPALNAEQNEGNYCVPVL